MPLEPILLDGRQLAENEWRAGRVHPRVRRTSGCLYTRVPNVAYMVADRLRVDMKTKTASEPWKKINRERDEVYRYLRGD